MLQKTFVKSLFRIRIRTFFMGCELETLLQEVVPNFSASLTMLLKRGLVIFSKALLKHQKKHLECFLSSTWEVF